LQTHFFFFLLQRAMSHDFDFNKINHLSLEDTGSLNTKQQRAMDHELVNKIPDLFSLEELNALFLPDTGGEEFVHPQAQQPNSVNFRHLVDEYIMDHYLRVQPTLLPLHQQQLDANADQLQTQQLVPVYGLLLGHWSEDGRLFIRNSIPSEFVRIFTGHKARLDTITSENKL
jgi:hypothetical protein